MPDTNKDEIQYHISRFKLNSRLIVLLAWDSTFSGIVVNIASFMAWVLWEATKLSIVVLAVMFLLSMSGPDAEAATTIPRAAEAHRATLIKTSRMVWGIDAPVSVFAAQVHTESRWNTEAKSHVGASGLAQFMPTTAAWLPSVAPETGEPMPNNPGWALRALVTYDLYLWNRIQAVNDFERMAFVLSAYNGGLGWVNRDKKLAEKSGINPLRWFGFVETVNAGRSPANISENRNYPRLILHNRQQLYIKAGWGPGLPESEL